MKNDIPSYIRTYVPLFVAWLVGLLAERGVIVPESVSTPFALLLGALAAAVYYALVRLLEKHKGKFGWLLLAAKQPVYIDPSKTPEEQKSEVQRAIKNKAANPTNPVIDDFDSSEYLGDYQGEHEADITEEEQAPPHPRTNL